MSDGKITQASPEEVLAVAAALATCVKWRRVVDLQLLLRGIQSGQVGGPLTDWLVDCGWSAGGMSDLYEAANFVMAKQFPLQRHCDLGHPLGMGQCTELTPGAAYDFYNQHFPATTTPVDSGPIVLAAFDLKSPSTPSRALHLFNGRRTPPEQVWRLMCSTHQQPEILRLDTRSVNVFLVAGSSGDDKLITLSNCRASSSWQMQIVDPTSPWPGSDHTFPGNGRTRLIFPCSPRAVLG